jgi:SAM-dependent methyltransferase
VHFASYYRWLVYTYLFNSDGFPPNTNVPILDIGCKEADFLQLFNAPLKVGLDQNYAYLPKNKDKLELITADATHLPLRGQYFGCVLLNDVIEHVRDDWAAIRSATDVVALNGVIWISTTGLHYSVGPNILTRQFERAWGHVRRGYTPETLVKMIGPEFKIRCILWYEPFIRIMQAPLWCLSRIAMPLACKIAYRCFKADCDIYENRKYKGSLNGHIYISARRIK